MNYILTCGKGRKTALCIKDYIKETYDTDIGLTENSEDIPDGSTVIRYGNTSDTELENRCRVIQTRDSIIKSSDKYSTFEQLIEEGITVPTHSRDFEFVLNNNGYPVIGRNDNHHVGEEIGVILQKRDLDYFNFDYFLNYIPVKEEFRIYVYNGEVFSLAIKGTKEGFYSLPMSMRKNQQCKFVELKAEGESNAKFPDGTRHIVTEEVKNGLKEMAINACSTLGLTFSALDVILGEDDKLYFLEANTAFGLVTETDCPDCSGSENDNDCERCDNTGIVYQKAKRFKTFCELLNNDLSQNTVDNVHSILEDENRTITVKDLKSILSAFGVNI